MLLLCVYLTLGDPALWGSLARPVGLTGLLDRLAWPVGWARHCHCTYHLVDCVMVDGAYPNSRSGNPTTADRKQSLRYTFGWLVNSHGFLHNYQGLVEAHHFCMGNYGSVNIRQYCSRVLISSSDSSSNSHHIVKGRHELQQPSQHSLNLFLVTWLGYVLLTYMDSWWTAFAAIGSNKLQDFATIAREPDVPWPHRISSVHASLWWLSCFQSFVIVVIVIVMPNHVQR